MLLLFKGLLRDPIRRPIAVALAAALCLLIVVPQPAHAQFGTGIAAVIAAAGAVVDFINKTIGPLFDTAISSLKDINKVTQAFSDLWQKIVYPLDLIKRALSLANQLMTIFAPITTSIHNISVLSATLPNPASLETIMRNRSIGDFPSFDLAFRQTYQPVPAANDIEPGDRQRVDMSDAMSMGVLKQLKASDQAVEQTLRAADLLEQEATQQSPGSAAFLSGSGIVAAVENQATMQRMLAALLRDEAAVLGQTNAAVKRHADFSYQFRGDTASTFK